MIDHLTAKILPARKIKPRAIILHGTGSTVLENVLGYYCKAPDPGEQHPDMACSHLIIDTGGLVYRIADPATQEAWHCAMHPEEADLYAKGFAAWSLFKSENHKIVPNSDGAARYAEWRKRWPKFQSPLEMVTASHPNLFSIGIEFLSPENPTPRIYTDQQYDAAALELRRYCAMFGIAENDQGIYGHSDANPLARTDRAGGWDPGHDAGANCKGHPGAFDWAGLFNTLQGIKK